MANTVEITVKFNDSAAIAEMAALEAESKNSADRQGSTWESLGSRIGNVFKGVGGFATAALGVGLTTPLAAAGVALAGFGAIAAPTLDKVEKALTTTGAAGKKAWADLDPAQRQLATSIRGLQTSFDGIAKSLEPVVSGVAQMGISVASALLPALGPLAKAGAQVITDFLGPLQKLLTSNFFSGFISQVSQLATELGPTLGKAFADLLKVLMQLVEQAGPAAVQIFQALVPAIVNIASGLVPVIAGVTKLAAAFINWLSSTHLLIPALIAVGAAMTVAGGPISVLVAGVALVVGGLMHLWQTSQTFREVVTTAFSDVGRAVLSLAEIWLTEMQVIANIFLTTVGIIIHGAADAFGWIPGVGGKLKQAAAAFDGFKSDVNNVFDAAHAKIEGWKGDLANMPKVVKLQGDISDLTAKLNDAKSQLKDPNLTATRRAKLEAEISQLQAAIAEARRELAAINGTTATTYVNTVMTSTNNPYPGGISGRKAAGGIVGGAAGGGPRSLLTLVGEHGPELVRLPGGSQVFSNPDASRMAAGAGSGPVNVQLEVAPGGASAFEQFMVEALRYWVRIKGGGNVQTAFGRN